MDAPSPPHVRKRRTETRAEELRVALADDIVRGRLAPGATLEEIELAGRFGVSRTPVREAIRELTASGLVEARPHRSAIVAMPTIERLRSIFEVMADLEALCAGYAAVHMTPQERNELEVLHDTLSAVVRSGDPQRYHELNERFHGAIYDGGHNDYLAELAYATRRRLSPFRRAQFRQLGRLQLSHAEHERVVTAILRGDRAGAADAMRSHIVTVEVAYERYAGTV
jgi:DNA-binding GntR family transcriptional regulator